MLKPFVIHGVGQVILFDYLTGREILRITKQESATWNFTYEDTDVSGGDDLDPFDSFETGRAQSVTFVDNRFDVRQLEAATGKRVVATLNVPVTEMNEGFLVPDAPGPYTHTLAFAATAEAGTYRLRFNSTWEDFAPQPTLPAANAVEVADPAGNFTLADSVAIRIVTILTSGIKSVCSATVTKVIVAAKAYIDVTLPANVLTTPTGMPNFDVNELAGFDVYVKVGAAAEYKSNAAVCLAGSLYRLLASPGAGLGSPNVTPTLTGQFTVAAGVITFAAVDAGVEVLVDYVWRTSASVAECEVVDVLKNCLRSYMRAIWSVKFRASDGTMKGMEMDIFKLKYTGDYNLEMTRADATSHSMEFKILDPERADKKVVGWKIFPLPATAGCN